MVEQLALNAWLVWILPMAGAVLAPALSALGRRLRDYGAVAFSFASAAYAATLLPGALQGRPVHHQIQWMPALGIKAGVLVDPLSAIMANVVGWISFLIMFYSLEYMKDEDGLTRYWFLMNFFIGNMQLIVLSDNLLQLFFGWEGVGFCSYALIGFWHSDEEKYWVGTPGEQAWRVPLAYTPSHAGMKAFITTRVGDLAFLAGLFLLYYASGTFELRALAENTQWANKLAASGLLLPAALLIFAGAVGKSAQFPLHEWLPDAMAGPTSVSALIHAATMVKAGVYLVARMGPIFYVAAVSIGQADAFFSAVAWIGAFTAFLTATQAMVSRELKKVLAYSTVSQIGYMMLALGAAGLAASFAEGYVAGFFHLTSHAAFKAALFMAAGALIHAARTKYMDEMGGLSRKMRLTWVAVLLAGASLAGLPPLTGFWSKDAVLASVLAATRYPLAPALYFLATVTALMTAFYTFRMIGLIFYGPESHYSEGGELHRAHDPSPVMWLPYLLLAGSSLVGGFVGPLIESSLGRALGNYLEEYGVRAEHTFVLNPFAVTTSLVAAAAGSGIGIYIYIFRKADPKALVSGPLNGLYFFFVNRWYINSFYYRVFAYTTTAFSRISFRIAELAGFNTLNDAVSYGTVVFSRFSDWFDLHIVDGFVNGVAAAGTMFSRAARRLQTGVAQNYLFAFALGAVLVTVLLAALAGGL